MQTLTNAIALNRLAQVILTGVRGIGKTSAACIPAKGLNWEGVGGPTVSPCGFCGPCKDINDDVILMFWKWMPPAIQALMMRDIIDGSAHRPVSARFKVYIVDEVHMLSRNAFNALLKTLEEPPDNVKFIFATIKIRKVPGLSCPDVSVLICAEFLLMCWHSICRPLQTQNRSMQMQTHLSILPKPLKGL